METPTAFLKGLAGKESFALLNAQAKWEEKLRVGFFLYLWVSLPYYLLQRYSVFPETILYPSSMDRLIPFDDRMIWFYLSLFLFLLLPPILMTDSQRLNRYAIGMILMSLIADFFFFFFPTSFPRPNLDSVNFGYRAVISIDQPLNAFPSLHAAMGIYSALFLQEAMGAFRHSWRNRAAVWIWLGMILYATLATKQHGVIDLIAGASLSVVTYLFPFRRKDKPEGRRRKEGGRYE